MSDINQAADFEKLITQLRSEAASHSGDPTFGKLCAEMLLQENKERLFGVLVEAAAFGTLSPVESFRRLDLLSALQPGTFCSDKTWGFGVVRAIDDFYKRITIDFDRRRNHQMTLAYAAESLSLVDDNHLLARRHTDPDGLAALVRERPAEVVYLALSAFGFMSVTRLEEMLVESRVVAQSEWKGFWERARRGLKDDPRVVIPQKRSDPITLISGTQDYGDVLLAKLGRERDVSRILELIAEVETVAADKVATSVGVIAERLSFALKGAFNTDPANYARLAMMAERLQIADIDGETLRSHLWENDRFLTAAAALSARDAAEFAVYLLRERPAAQQRIVTTLAVLPHAIMGDVLQIVYEGTATAAAAVACRNVLHSSQINPVMLVWALRNYGAFPKWELPALYELLLKGVNLLEERHSGEGLRMQNVVRGFFANDKWFSEAFSGLDQLQRQALFERVQASPTWEPAARHKLMTLMRKVEPDLKTRRKAPTIVESAAERLTSWRSLAARQETYRHLVEVEMLQNRRDIAEARSYGDLRENFEYQSAREQQRLLMQRMAEMDADLRQVKGSDFAGAPTDIVSVGTAVTFELADGTRQTYHILGEWDRDEALRIISNKSRLAGSLLGKRVGETAAIPGVEGEVSVTVTEIGPLPDSVREWCVASAQSVATPSAGE